MKDNNQRVVMDCLRKCSPISRRDLAIQIGLTSATITNIVNSLMNDDMIIETGLAAGERGRRPILLDLNADFCNVVGVAVTGNQMDIVICDFKASVKTLRKIPFDMSEPSDVTIDRMIEGIRASMRTANVTVEDVAGIGLAVPGPIDYENGIVLNPPNLPEWKNVRLREIIANEFGIPVYLDKESNAAALAEYYFGAASGHKTVFCFNVYEVGVGGGLLRTGNIFHGYRDNACEIGHITLDMNGPLCSCGNYGCLESMLRGSALTDQALRGLNEGKQSVLKKDSLSLRALLDAADEGDELAASVVRKAAEYASVAIGNIICMYSPEMIILGGDLPLSSKLFTEQTAVAVHSRSYPAHCKDIEIHASELGSLSGPLGAVALVFEGMLKY